MPKLSCAFSQSDFRLRHYPSSGIQGLCLALCAQWCRYINQDAKDSWSNPLMPAEVRLQKFQNDCKKIKLVQEKSLELLSSLSKKFGHLEDVINTFHIMKQSGFLESERQVTQPILSANQDYLNFGDEIPQKMIGYFGNQVGNIHPISTIDELVPHLNPKTCHILILQTNIPSQPKGQHALAIYVSSGLLNYDYHIFDPNTGELKATGVDDLKFIFRNIEKTYFPTSLRYCLVK